MDWKEAAGTIVGGLALLIPGIKWLISDWAKKAEKIEELRAENHKLSIESFGAKVAEFKAMVIRLETDLQMVSKVLQLTREEVADLKTKLTRTETFISDYMKNQNANVEKMIKSEIKELTDKLILIRTKRNGQN